MDGIFDKAIELFYDSADQFKDILNDTGKNDKGEYIITGTASTDAKEKSQKQKMYNEADKKAKEAQKDGNTEEAEKYEKDKFLIGLLDEETLESMEKMNIYDFVPDGEIEIQIGQNEFKVINTKDLLANKRLEDTVNICIA
jgi:hypothetical protein